MNTQPNAIPASPFDSPDNARAALAATRPMYWSLRREIWENRSIYIAPLIVAGVVLIGFVIATIGRAVATVDLAGKAAVLTESNGFAAGVIMATTFIVAIFYCLDALHGERRDRSILFWKSLPVSDVTTVLSKAIIAIVVLPLLTFAIIVLTQMIMAVLSTVVMVGSGLGTAALSADMSFFPTSLRLFYHLLTVHMLWHAPIYAWLLLVSGWARRATFLWAVLPPLAIVIVEKVAFGTAHFAAMLGYRLGGPEIFKLTPPNGLSIHSLMELDPGKFLGNPGLWIGLGVAALFLAGAVRLRRYRGPI